MFAFEERLELFDLVNADEGGAVDAKEEFGIEILLEGGEGVADEVVFFGGMEEDIIGVVCDCFVLLF